MDDLILSFSSTYVNDPLTNLIKNKELVEEILISTKSDQDLHILYQQIESYNTFIKQNVSFDFGLYNENYILQNIIDKCDHYYNLSSHGTIRHRLVNTLNLYNHILIAINYKYT